MLATMALKPLADEDGDIPINVDGEGDPRGELLIDSLGDPALDRIWLKSNAAEMKLRQLSADVARIKKTTDALRIVIVLWWVVVGLLAMRAVLDFVRG
jgi:hypothetical protein